MQRLHNWERGKVMSDRWTRGRDGERVRNDTLLHLPTFADPRTKFYSRVPNP